MSCFLVVESVWRAEAISPQEGSVSQAGGLHQRSEGKDEKEDFIQTQPDWHWYHGKDMIILKQTNIQPILLNSGI